MRLALCVLLAVTACGGASDTVAQQLASTPDPSAASSRADPSSLATPESSISGTAVATASGTSRRFEETARPTPVRAPSTEPDGSGAGSVAPARTATPAAQPPPPSSFAPRGTVTVTQDNDGQTVRLVVGDRLRVRLTTGTWDPPASGEPSVVVRRSSSGGYPSDQPVDALFEAVARGSTDVTAQSNAACFSAQPPCQMPQRQWSVHVVVG